MAKGQEAKDLVIEKIKEAFGDKFIGVIDKKVYVWSKEDGQDTQVCLALTCPKTPVGNAPAVSDGLDFENMPSAPTGQPTQFKPAEITSEETENIRKMLEKLGL